MLKQQKTQLYYPEMVDEKINWLRIAIRRGVVHDIIYCLLNMDPTDAWLTMMEASFTDVGLADPFTPIEVTSSYEEWKDYERHREHGISRAILVRTGVFLGMAPKSRTIAHCELLHLVHLKPAVSDEDKCVSLDPYCPVRLDTYRMSQSEPWYVRQSLVCIARGILEKDDNRSVSSAIRLHIIGKGHLVWVIIGCLQDRYDEFYGWARKCTKAYADAWKFMATAKEIPSMDHAPMSTGDEPEASCANTMDLPGKKGLAAIVQGVLLLPCHGKVPREERKTPWGQRTIVLESGFPKTSPISRTDLPYWIKLADKCGETSSKRVMPDSVLDITTQRGRQMQRGVDHYFRTSDIITNRQTSQDPFLGPAYSGLKQVEALLLRTDGFDTLIKSRTGEIKEIIEPASASELPPLPTTLLSKSASLPFLNHPSDSDEGPSDTTRPESPSKKRRTRYGGGVILPSGLTHTFGSENVGHILRVGPKRMKASLLSNNFRKVLCRLEHDRPAFCPSALAIFIGKTGDRYAIIGDPWNKKNAFETMTTLEPGAAICPTTTMLGCLAFRYVFGTQGGLNLVRTNDPSTRLFCVGEQEVLTGPSYERKVAPKGWKDFVALADRKGVLDSAIEALAFWQQFMTKNGDIFKGKLEITQNQFLQIQTNLNHLMTKEGWFSKTFLCFIDR